MVRSPVLTTSPVSAWRPSPPASMTIVPPSMTMYPSVEGGFHGERTGAVDGQVVVAEEGRVGFGDVAFEKVGVAVCEVVLGARGQGDDHLVGVAHVQGGAGRAGAGP